MQKTITTRFILLLLALFMILGIQEKAHAQQDTTTLWNIITNDGNEYNGFILLKNETEIQFKTNNIGTITLLLSNIKKMTEVKPEDIKGDEVWLDNLQDGRYFFSPSSYGLKKGQGYYQNTWVFFNQLSYGVTDNFSMGIGTVPAFLFGGNTPVWITPKISFPITENTFAIGGGALVGTVLGEGGSYGIVYGTSTLGSRDKNLTFGLGYGYVDDEFANSPALTISSLIRVSKKGYFITENYLIDTGEGTTGILSFGGRRVWRNVSLDFGGLLPVGGGSSSLVIIPWLSVVISFGS